MRLPRSNLVMLGITMEDTQFNHIGWIALDDSNVTNVVSSLRKDNGRFTCVVPLQSLEEFPAEWFIDPHFIGAKRTERVDIPSPLWLADSESNKTFCLLGCSRSGYKAFNFSYGYGRMTPEYVIEGVLGYDYSSVNAIRALSPLFLRWTGMTSLFSNYELSEKDNTLESYTVGFGQVDSVELGTIGGIDVEIRPSASATRKNHGEEILLSNTVYFATRSENKAPLPAHLDALNELRDLACVALFDNITYISASVLCDDDRPRYIDGGSGSARWREMHLAYCNQDTSNSAKKTFLFLYNDLNEGFFESWHSLVTQYQKGMRELVFMCKHHKNMPVEVALVNYCIAIEGIGHKLRVEIDASLSRSSFHKSLQALVSDFETHADGWFPLEDIERWQQDVADTYNCVKHLDCIPKVQTRDHRLRPQNIYEVSTSCEMVLRCWVAVRLGCSAKTLKNNVSDNRYRFILERWEKR